MTDASYDELVARSPQGSPFATSWWLDAVAGAGNWSANAVAGADGALVAAWPTIRRSGRFGTVHVGAPLTPWLGPIMTAGDGKQARSRELEQLEQLLDGMRPFAHLEARCHPSFDYWTPLRWNGFEQTTHYTWRIEGVRDPEIALAGLRDSARRQIKKAGKLGLEVVEGTVEDFLPLHAKTFSRQRVAAPAAALVRRIDEAASPRDARTVLLARDPDGRVHSASYFVHDEHCTWYLMGGSDTELRSSGSASLVMWEAIRRSVEAGRDFDFEGSMLRHVERFVRGFGGRPVPYSIVRSTPSRGMRWERSLKRALKRGSRR